MVRTRINQHAKINIDKLKTAINTIFGRTLSLRVDTETIDAYGQLSDLTSVTTSFMGDLQFGMDLDQKYIASGIVEVGDGVLYIYPGAITISLDTVNIVIDGNSEWEIISQIEAPELGGTVCHYSYRCKRRPETNDN